MGNNTQTSQVNLTIGGDAAKQLEALKQQAKQLAEQMDKASKIGNTQELNRTRRQYHQVLTQIGEIAGAQEKFNTALKNINLTDMKELIRLQKQIQTVMMSGHVAKGSKEWKEYYEKLGMVNKQISKMKAEMGAAGQGGLSRMFSGLFGSSGAGAIAGGLTKLAGVFGVAMSAGQAFTKVMRELYQINKEFEQQQANLASVLGKTRSEIKDLTAQAKQLGETTLYTASEVSGLQLNLAKLGFSEKQIKQATRPILDFALATGAQLPEAASVAGSSLRAFGLDASEMERVVSTMAVATTKSALDFEKLRTSISITFPVAKSFGFTIEDTVTLLAKLSDAGFEASSAATATRNILLNMANPAGRLAKALGNPIHNVKELGEAFKELKERNISLCEAFALTDKRSVSAFMRFVETAGVLDEFKDSITDVDEGLRNMVEERMNTLQGSVTILNSAWQGLMLTFDSSNGIFKKVVDGLTGVIRKTIELFSTVEENANRRSVDRAETLTRQRKNDWKDYIDQFDLTDEATRQGLLDSLTSSQADIDERINAAKAAVAAASKKPMSGWSSNQKQNDIILQNIKDLENAENNLTELLVEEQRLNFIIGRLNSAAQGGADSNYDKDAMKKQRAAIELRIKQEQLAEEQRYLKEKEKFDDMTYEEQEEADKQHWTKMYEIEIQGYREISKLYTGNNDQLEASFEGRAVTSEKKLADKLFAITTQYANKDEKLVLTQEKMRIDAGKKRLDAEKANAIASANYEYEQFVLNGGRKDEAERNLRESMLMIDQIYYTGLNALYSEDISKLKLSKVTKKKLQEQYDAEALKALAERTKKESEYNKKITDEVLKNEDELRKMGEKFDKQNKLDIFGEADAKLALKRYELDNMLSLYDAYFHNLLADESLTAEEREQIEKLYAKKVKQINEQLTNWEGLNTRERYKAVVEIVGKAMSEVSTIMGNVQNLMSAKYELQKEQVENRYDAEIKAAEKVGRSTTRLEKEKENELNKINRAQAKNEYAASVAQIQIDTAMAISRAWADNPYWMAAIVSALATANMGIQMATVKKQYEAKMASYSNGFAEGGYTGDGRKYHRVAGVVHDGEFVANHYAVNNPQVRPVLDAIDYAQRNNTIASMTRDDVALAAGFANGGYTSDTRSNASQTDGTITRLTRVLESLEANGVAAYTWVNGPGGINDAQKKSKKLYNNSHK